MTKKEVQGGQWRKDTTKNNIKKKNHIRKLKKDNEGNIWKNEEAEGGRRKKKQDEGGRMKKEEEGRKGEDGRGIINREEGREGAVGGRPGGVSRECPVCILLEF